MESMEQVLCKMTAVQHRRSYASSFTLILINNIIKLTKFETVERVI